MPRGRFQTRLVSSGQTDIEGLSPATKALLDGMVAAGVVPELKVKSGRRDEAANAAAGGAKGSQHLAGNALDIDIAGKSDAEKAAILAAAVAGGARGIGLYAGGRSLHVDTRQAPTVWGLDGADAYRGLKKPDGTPDIEATLAKAPAWARPTLQKLYGEPDGTLPLPAFGETPVDASPGALDYFGLVRRHESGGNDQAASRGPDGQTIAVGRYQFTAGTWAALAQKHPGLELSADGRSDPGQQDRAMRALTADNQVALAKAGLPITGANTYMAHFLGAAGAVKFLQALQEDPDQSAADLFPAAAASNKGVFYDHNSGGARSLTEVYRRQTAMFGADAGQPVYSAGPGYADAPADPAFADISPRDQDRLLDQATTRRREGESLSRGALESGVRDATRDLTTIGRHDGPLPGIADFTKAYGPQAGARRHADFQRIVDLGADIDAIKAMTPAEQTAWLARFAPQGDGPDPDGARDRHARAEQAIALNLAFRSKDPNAYIRALNPRIDQLWTEAGTSPERLKTALSATNAAMDRLGMPVEERRLIPKAMVDQALAAFGDRSKPMAQRLAPLRAALVAGADPKAQQAIFGQMVSAGLPPMLEYAAIAYARGDASLAERFATAALGSPDASGRATSSADDASSASPAAAANTAAGPAPMRSLSGPAIDLGPAAAQALGSSLTGDERSSRAETVRARMIEDATSNNGGDRPAAIAQTDRDLASLQGDGWAPGMFMRERGGPVAVQVAQAASIDTSESGTQTPVSDLPPVAGQWNQQGGLPAKASADYGALSPEQVDQLPDSKLYDAYLQAKSRGAPQLSGSLAREIHKNQEEFIAKNYPRLQKYTEDEPYAEAVYDTNQLDDKDSAPQPKGNIERLPLDAGDLTERLGIPKEALTSKMLRDDDTGFRAVLYLNKKTQRYILVGRDTQPHSIVDWLTNFENKDKLTSQYHAILNLAKTLDANGIKFDLAGYSKGGGMAQYAGAYIKGARIRVFNSAGVPDVAKDWIGGVGSMDDIKPRTRAYSAEKDFITELNQRSADAESKSQIYLAAKVQYDNAFSGVSGGGLLGGNISDFADQYSKQLGLDDKLAAATEAQQALIAKAQFLRDRLAGGRAWGIALDSSIKIQYENPNKKNTPQDDVEYLKKRRKALNILDNMIAEYKKNPWGSGPFPPVRANNIEVVSDSEGMVSQIFSSPPLKYLRNSENVAGLSQHTPGNFLHPMQSYISKSRAIMKTYVNNSNEYN
ncbi:D-Ala-D-Ala carboxypeptidase family metallohydrolase [Labrys sp. 22185]|uniref:D-Ala-D-Ala carboxypeptidase family metallohydrolase n=1 Tax=Labrys sp. 22185 TaxID=3453888 RepID=UPI003F8648E2